MFSKRSETCQEKKTMSARKVSQMFLLSPQLSVIFNPPQTRAVVYNIGTAISTLLQPGQSPATRSPSMRTKLGSRIKRPRRRMRRARARTCRSSVPVLTQKEGLCAGGTAEARPAGRPALRSIRESAGAPVLECPAYVRSPWPDWRGGGEGGAVAVVVLSQTALRTEKRRCRVGGAGDGVHGQTLFFPFSEPARYGAR